jgi:hypothetical protein
MSINPDLRLRTTMGALDARHATTDQDLPGLFTSERLVLALSRLAPRSSGQAVDDTITGSEGTRVGGLQAQQFRGKPVLLPTSCSAGARAGGKRHDAGVSTAFARRHARRAVLGPLPCLPCACRAVDCQPGGNELAEGERPPVLQPGGLPSSASPPAYRRACPACRDRGQHLSGWPR